ncbi:hypothetical protein [Poseidonocella sp. HB161398]|uniref:hypothetical protein n=1 Tax=Poseidonocella sp. HB161398 TaxID=2320855 RepID=UPI001107F5DF|nr:hypothetical protein [Poseidonocella sp. HB161398]
MTRGLLAGLVFGLFVAALVLGIAALQLERAKWPEPPVMIPPVVAERFALPEGPLPPEPRAVPPVAPRPEAGLPARAVLISLPQPGTPAAPVLPAPPPDPARARLYLAPPASGIAGPDLRGAPGTEPPAAPSVAAPQALAPLAIPADLAEPSETAQPGLAAPAPAPALPDTVDTLVPGPGVLAAGQPLPRIETVPPAPAGGGATLVPAAPPVPGDSALLAPSGLPAAPPAPPESAAPPAPPSVAALTAGAPATVPAATSPAMPAAAPRPPANAAPAAEPAAPGALPAPDPSGLDAVQAAPVAPDLQLAAPEVSPASEPAQQGTLPTSEAPPAAPGTAGEDGPPLLAVVLVDPRAAPLPEWARSVALAPAEAETAPAGREVLLHLDPGTDEAALAAAGQALAGLAAPGPLLITAGPGEGLPGAFAALAASSGQGAVIEGGAAPARGQAAAYPAAPLSAQLARAAVHARRDGAVILVLPDSAAARRAVGDFLDGPGSDLIPATAGEALRLLAQP